VIRSTAFSLFTSVSFVVQILAHLRRDAIRIRAARRKPPAAPGSMRALQRVSHHSLHAPGIASEQDADFIVGAVALVDAHLLPTPPRQIHQLGGNGQPRALLQQRPQPPAQRGCPEYRGRPNASLITGLSELPISSEPLPAPHVQARLAMQLALEQQFRSIVTAVQWYERSCFLLTRCRLTRCMQAYSL